MDIKIPPQKKTFKQKDKVWRKECVDSLDKGLSYSYNLGTRRTIRNKIINQNLYEGKLDIADMMKVLNPSNTKADYIPRDIQHQPIIVPKIDLLVGEELKRPFDWTVMVGDYTAVSMKLQDKKDLVDKKITELISSNKSEEEIKAELEKFKIYFKYEWKDLREVRANKLLKHYFRALNMKEKLNECFRDALIMGEEAIQCDIQGNEPTFEKLNPKKLHTLRSGYSGRIEDSDVIIIEDYWSPGRIIDTWYEHLTPDEVERLNSGTMTASTNFSTDAYANSYLIGSSESTIIDGYIATSEIGGNEYSRVLVDNSGNVRVLRVYWRSQKMVYKVTYIDEQGEAQVKIMSEEYIADKNRGEIAEKLWINEWWEGGKVGGDIYLPIRPKPVQYSRLSNPSIGHPGIVGEIYNYNQGKATSFVDRMKSYQYLYDIIWYRVGRAIEKNLGKILMMDLSKIPTNWTVDRWMSYAVTNGFGFIDSTKEINKGPATGKLVGNFNTSDMKAIDVETGNYIQQHILLLDYIKKEMSEITGITPQRQGATSASETLGGVERAVIQSSNNTEWWFFKHEGFKIRALTVFLETAKIALKGNKLKLQHILDDFSAEVFDIDGDEFAEFDYDIFVTSESKAKEMNQVLNQMAHAFMQNGGNLGVVMDILFSDSMADKRKRVELVEYEKSQAEQAQVEQQQQIAQQQMQVMAEKEDKERELKLYEIDSNNNTKIYIEQLKLGIADKELDVKSEETSQDILLRIKELDQADKQHQEKIKVDKIKARSKKS